MSVSTSSRAARASSKLGGEDQVVGGLADAVLLGGLELGGAQVLEGLHDASVGLRALGVHGVHVIVRLGVRLQSEARNSA